MALVAWLVYQLLKTATKKAMFAEIAGGIAGTIVMAVGYFVYEVLLFTTAGVAVLNMPWNLLQGGVGITIAVAVMRVLTATKVLDKFGFYKS